MPQPFITQPLDLGNTFARAAQIQGLRDKNEFAKIQMQQLSDEADQRNNVNTMVAELLSGGGDVSQLGQFGQAGLEAAGGVLDLRTEVSNLEAKDRTAAIERGRFTNDAANNILNSNNPVQMAALAMKDPTIREMFPNFDPASMDRETLLAAVQDVADQTSFFNEPQEVSSLISGPEVVAEGFAPGTVIQRTTERGQPTGTSVLQRPPTKGLSLTVGPEGEVEFSQGGPVDLSKKTTGQLEGDVLKSQAGLVRLKTIGQSFQDRFLTIGGKAKALFQKGKEIAGFDLSPQEKQELTEFTTFKVDTLKNLNLYIKEITGAAMSAAEAGRITASLPNLNQAPTEFKAAFASSMKQLNIVQSRSFHALKNGLSPLDIPLESMPGIIDARGAFLEQQLQQEGITPEQLQQAVLDQLNREFGL